MGTNVQYKVGEEIMSEKAKNILYYAVLFTLFCAIVFSLWKLYHIFTEYNAAEVEYKQVSEKVTKPAEDPEEECPISVDFDALRKINPDVVGWIYSEDTPINYPVLQGETNDEYIYHTIEKQYNSSGSIFMDSFNDPALTDYNTVLYGHHMKNGSMFASIKKYSKQEYADEHPVLWYLTPERNYRLTVFSGFVDAPDSKVYSLFLDRIDFELYLDRARKKNNFKQSAEASMLGDSDIDHIMVLSTCDYSYDNARYVLVCTYHLPSDLPHTE